MRRRPRRLPPCARYFDAPRGRDAQRRDARCRCHSRSFIAPYAIADVICCFAERAFSVAIAALPVRRRFAFHRHYNDTTPRPFDDSDVVQHL
jgi:hypothetical protein